MMVACAAHGQPVMPVLEHLSAALVHLLDNPSLRPQAVANIMHSFAHLRYRDVPSLEALCKYCKANLDKFNTQEVSNISWALASLAYLDSQLLEALRTRAIHIALGISEKQLASHKAHILTQGTSLPSGRNRQGREAHNVQAFNSGTAPSEASTAALSNTGRGAVLGLANSKLAGHKNEGPADEEEERAVLGQFLWSFSVLGCIRSCDFVTLCTPLAFQVCARRSI